MHARRFTYIGIMARKRVSCEMWLLRRIELINDFERLLTSGSTINDFANLVLREFEDYQEEHERIMHLQEFQSEYSELLADFRRAVYGRTANAYNGLVDFIGLPSSKGGLRLQLEHLQADARALRELARLNERSKDSLSFRITNYIYVALNPNGTLRIVRSGIVQRISREGLLANRVRRCPSCGCIFWMKTKRSKTCKKKKCSDRADYQSNKKKK